LPDQSQELEVIECVTLVNEMGGKTERIWDETRQKDPRNWQPAVKNL
jgi:hypothetical protein